MKIALITIINSDDPHQIGVWQKIIGMQKGFNANGLDCDIYHLSDHGININQMLFIKSDERNTNKVRFVYDQYFRLLFSNVQFSKYNAVWVRHAYYGNYYLKKFHHLKKNHPKITLFYEVPTYPYIEEFVGLKKLLVLLYQKLVMKNLKKTFDKIITYSDHTTLFGTSTIQIDNGIDVLNLPKAKPSAQNKQIELVAIGVLWSWFGLDRILKGMNDYIKNSTTNLKISLSIYGKGQEYNHLSSMVNDLNLDQYVKFNGWVDQRMLSNQLTDNMIGIGTLGRHRVNVAISSPLKHRDYIARGIPIIHSCGENNLNNSLPFVHTFEANDQPIDMEEVIKFYYKTRGMSSVIRNYAEQHLDWSAQLKPVIDYVQSTHQHTSE